MRGKPRRNRAPRRSARPRDRPPRPRSSESRRRSAGANGSAFRSFTLPLGTTSSIACGLSSRCSISVEDVPGIDRERNSVTCFDCARSSELSDGGLPLLVGASDCVPGGRGAADAHQRPGHERAAAELDRELVGGGGFADVVPGGNEHELRRDAAGDEPPDRAGRRAEAPTRAHALVRRCGGAVHRDLHAFDGKARQALGRALVDAAAVGLDLERDAARGEPLEDLPAVRHAERLAAAEGDVGNAGLDDAAREAERLIAARARRARRGRGPIPRSTRCSARCSGW